MNIAYSNEKLSDWRNSIFLAGPTPRSDDVKSWRPEALALLNGFAGAVIVPEWRESGHGCSFNYLDQVEWEHEMLTKCSVIAFWVPRDLKTMPSFTTNVEFGRFVGRRPTVYGRPPFRPKNDYLDWYYEKMTGLKPLNILEKTMRAAVDMAANEALGRES